jgi:hypothetical protein
MLTVAIPDSFNLEDAAASGDLVKFAKESLKQNENLSRFSDRRPSSETYSIRGRMWGKETKKV